MNMTTLSLLLICFGRFSWKSPLIDGMAWLRCNFVMIVVFKTRLRFIPVLASYFIQRGTHP
ncbi:hypothetical protein M430DRAFT_182883 [Amorphotheca resinae ATCC 22711]|uniref:Uncharacterized protein n=1 Tax=Amorphotheca resinae ATCC 22711 TaxID=857342 RepID=A0A2T3ARX1_AMORE|nr:hypothetical protein M430DRAFT_182883 [Amorphotheca resinae ATCC 22711]PSS09094.1 hypothetical protein M430DRAFT_182883 [Amorphotheca resinae ATCC 22711]